MNTQFLRSVEQVVDVAQWILPAVHFNPLLGSSPSRDFFFIFISRMTYPFALLAEQSAFTMLPRPFFLRLFLCGVSADFCCSQFFKACLVVSVTSFRSVWRVWAHFHSCYGRVFVLSCSKVLCYMYLSRSNKPLRFFLLNEITQCFNLII